MFQDFAVDIFKLEEVEDSSKTFIQNLVTRIGHSSDFYEPKDMENFISKLRKISFYMVLHDPELSL